MSGEHNVICKNKCLKKAYTAAEVDELIAKILRYNKAACEQTSENYNFTNNILKECTYAASSSYVTTGTVNILDRTLKVTIEIGTANTDDITDLFDGSTSNYIASTFIEFDFNTPVKINKLKTMIVSTGDSQIRYFEGSNDKSEWITLATIEKDQTSVTELTLKNTDYFKYYRMRGTSIGNHRELQIVDYDLRIHENNFVLDNEIFTSENIDNIPDCQATLVKTPQYDYYGFISSNTLNGLNITELLEPNSLYELIWNEEAKEIMSVRRV